MTKSMVPYYLSRAILALAFGSLFYLTGSTWWMALLITALILAFFLWAPRSGRYSFHPELGVTALRRDERTQAINDKAARNAFVVSMLAVAAAAIYYGLLGAASAPLSVLKVVLVIGVVVYFASDLWMRRS